MEICLLQIEIEISNVIGIMRFQILYNHNYVLFDCGLLLVLYQLRTNKTIVLRFKFLEKNIIYCLKDAYVLQSQYYLEDHSSEKTTAISLRIYQ